MLLHGELICEGVSELFEALISDLAFRLRHLIIGKLLK